MSASSIKDAEAVEDEPRQLLLCHVRSPGLPRNHAATRPISPGIRLRGFADLVTAEGGKGLPARQCDHAGKGDDRIRSLDESTPDPAYFNSLPLRLGSLTTANLPMRRSCSDNPDQHSVRSEHPCKGDLLLANEHYRADIDGLRAFAVISVVLFHALPNVVRGGYVGVDIFFVISGYLISRLLFTELSEHCFSFTAFYGRRIRRLAPALAACLAAVLAFGFVSLMPFELAQLGKHVFFGATFLSNIGLWSESGYFDAAGHLKPLLHLWSLGIEEQFYLIWPVVLWIGYRMKAKVGRLLAVLFLTSFAINIALSISNITADFYLPFSRFWELLAGAALALRRPFFLTSKARSCISIAGFAALMASVILFSPNLRFPGWLVLLPVAGAAAIVLAGPDSTMNRVVFSNRALVFVGLISYPLYLWHWPLISYGYVVRLGKAPTPLMATALVALSFLLAWSTYRFIERPVRFGAHRHRRTQIAAACVAVVGVCGLALWTKNGWPERFPPIPGIDIRKIGEAKRDADFKPTQGMKVLDQDWTLVTNLGKGDRKVSLSGDSMLFHYGPRVQQLADEGQLAANTYFVTGPRCPPVPGVIQRDKFARCANLPGILVDLVQREKVQAVVLGAAWRGYSAEGIGESMLIEREGKRMPLDTKEGMEAFYANLEDYIRLLQAQGAMVYLVLGVPGHHRFDPGEMVTRSLTGFRIAPDVEKAVPVAELQAVHAIVNTKLRTIGEHTGATLIDPLPDICGNGDGCLPFFGASEPKFSDGMHLRPVFVQKHLRFLDHLLK